MKTYLLCLPLFSLTILSASDACCSVANAGEAAPLYSDNSLFHLQATFLNPDGEKAQLADFKGKPFILAMFYATCPTVCPRMILDISKIDAQLDEAERSQLPILLVSFDPETDTPEKLKTFAENWDMETPRWQLWSGSPEHARTLAAGLGIRYRKAPDGEISHSAPITLVNSQGEIELQLAGPGVDSAPLIKQTKILLSASTK
ncbi:SCO family protein [Kiritimatiellaeota bacterium B1221]|nr:SCO family protein [Kiritimatiellaeota bacterium B1221]